jgi:hypothetical protein
MPYMTLALHATGWLGLLHTAGQALLLLLLLLQVQP